MTSLVLAAGRNGDGFSRFQQTNTHTDAVVDALPYLIEAQIDNAFVERDRGGCHAGRDEPKARVNQLPQTQKLGLRLLPLAVAPDDPPAARAVP